MSAFMDSKFGKRGGKEKIREEVVKDEGDLIFIYTIITVFYCPLCIVCPEPLTAMNTIKHNQA